MVASGILREGETQIVISGTSPAFELRDFLVRNRVPFDFRPDADAAHDVFCLLPGHDDLVDPSLEDVARALGLYAPASRSTYDVAIIGGGPAGLAASVYAASEGLSTALVERFAPGGQAGTTSRIENLLGFPDGISGAELAERSRDQALRFGVDFLLLREVVGRGETGGGLHRPRLNDGTELAARSLVIATGVDWRRLNRPGIDRLLHRGVYYGAAPGEAPGLHDKHVAVVGAGNSAGQAAVFFADWARSVSLLVRGERLSSTMSTYLADRLQAHPNITMRYGVTVEAAEGEDWLRAVQLSERGGTTTMSVQAMFVCIGGEPRTEWAHRDHIQLDAGGYLRTGSDLETDASGLPPGWGADRPPMPLETSLPALFAIGDVRARSTKRVSTAIGDGAMVVRLIHELLDPTLKR